MKLICLKKHLKDAVLLVEKATSKNLSLPVLNSILLSIKNGNVKLTATNLELGIEVNIPAKIEKEGRVAVPANVLSNFLSSFSTDENISLELLKDNLITSTTQTSTLIKTYPADDFPSLPDIKDKNSFSIPLNEFISGLKSVYYAASLSNIKPEISSIYIKSSKESPLTIIATDSFRLAEKKLSFNLKDFNPLLIPYKSIIEIIRVFDGRDGDIEIISDKNQVMFKSKQIKLISRLTEGIFPDYEQIIPKKHTTNIVIEKTALLNNLKTAGVFSGRLNEVNFNILSKDKSLEIKTSNQGVGSHDTVIPIEVDGEDLEINLNYRYIFDCLPYITSQKLNLSFSTANKPIVISGVGDSSFRYLVMPMNT